MQTRPQPNAWSFSRFLLPILLLVHVVVILLLFDPKMHVGGDDSDYIIAASEFWNGARFPSWHGSFYPIFLSVFMPLFRFHVVGYKVISMLLAVFHFILFYKAFRTRVPQAVLVFAMVMVALNWQLAYYASTTYSEVLFLFLQAAFFHAFFEIEDVQQKGKTVRYWQWLLLGGVIFLLSITRNIGMGVMIAVCLYFFIYRKWKNGAIVFGAFIAFQLLFTLYKNLYWGFGGSGLEGEFQRIAYKDFYDPTKGSEDVMGFIKRFWVNSYGYLSNHLAIILGLRKPGSQVAHAWLTALFYSVFLYAAVLSYKRNRAVFLLSIYLFVMMAVTFATLQVHWYQERLILIYLPLITISIGYFIYEMTFRRKAMYAIAGKAAMVLMGSLVFFRMIQAPKSIGTTILNLTSERNRYKGYDPEWRSYAELSEWAGKNIHEPIGILCRKPGLSTLYGGRRFTGISNFHYTVADSAVAVVERKKVDYVIFDQLTLPTVQRLMAYYVQKKPLGLKQVKEMGVGNKVTRLFKICKEDPVDDQDQLERLMTGIYVAPQSTYFYVLTGDKLVSMGKVKESLPYYNRALEIAPKDDQVMIRRGWAYLQAGDYKKSYVDVLRAATNNPKNERYAALLTEVKSRL